MWQLSFFSWSTVSSCWRPRSLEGGEKEFLGSLLEDRPGGELSRGACCAYRRTHDLDEPGALPAAGACDRRVSRLVGIEVWRRKVGRKMPWPASPALTLRARRGAAPGAFRSPVRPCRRASRSFPRGVSAPFPADRDC